MNELVVKVENVNGQLVVSSRVVAEQLGKRHDHVVRDLRLILEGIPKSGDTPENLIIPSTYINEQNKQEYKEYLLTKDGFTLYMFNIQGYNDFKMAYINKFNEMEKQLTNQFKVPTTFKEALQLALEQQEKIEELELENKVKSQQLVELQPKGTYYDLVLKSPNLINITTIAKDYGKSGQWLNQQLHNLHVQYKQSGIWLLYQDYADKGYTKTETVVVNSDTNDVKIHTKWTQAGRLFIYDKLKELGILPLIEK